MRYEEWLKGLSFRKTRGGAGKGVLIDLSFTIYPNGFGYLTYKNIDTGSDATQPVDTIEEALAKLRAVWECAQKLK